MRKLRTNLPEFAICVVSLIKKGRMKDNNNQRKKEPLDLGLFGRTKDYG